MKRKQCGYVYEQHEYRTDCGARFLTRPSGKCDRCGRKPMEKTHATSTNRPSHGLTG